MQKSECRIRLGRGGDGRFCHRCSKISLRLGCRADCSIRDTSDQWKNVIYGIETGEVCQYVCNSRQKMQEHSLETHRWKSKNKGDRQQKSPQSHPPGVVENRSLVPAIFCPGTQVGIFGGGKRCAGSIERRSRRKLVGEVPTKLGAGVKVVQQGRLRSIGFEFDLLSGEGYHIRRSILCGSVNKPKDKPMGIFESEQTMAARIEGVCTCRKHFRLWAGAICYFPIRNTGPGVRLSCFEDGCC